MRSLTEFLVAKLAETELFEMAFDRSEYKKAWMSLRYQLLENWCLIRYCTIINRTETKKHWKTELKAHMSNIIKMKIKLDKTKVANEVMIRGDELNNVDRVIFLMSDKWYTEGFDIESEASNQVASDFAEYGVYELIDIICKKNVTMQEVDDYINSI